MSEGVQESEESGIELVDFNGETFGKIVLDKAPREGWEMINRFYPGKIGKRARDEVITLATHCLKEGENIVSFWRELE